jgi:hypothetical protein
MANRRFKVGLANGVGVTAIWNGAGDTLPFIDPDGHADRVLFTTKWPYTSGIDKRTVNVTFPEAKAGGLRFGEVLLFAHGRSGEPRVRGNITINGFPLSLGCHVPVQYFTGNKLQPNPLPGLFRLAIIGATSTYVLIAWSADLSGAGSGLNLPQFTIPVTVEVTNEFN